MAAMESNIAALSDFQIRRFFSAEGCPTREQCDAMAARITGGSPMPTPLQGASSYAVTVGELIIQFRAPGAALDLDFIGHVQSVYAAFMPWHTYSGKCGGLHVYTMRKLGGVCMYLARASVYANGCYLLRQTLADFARLFASAWCNTSDSLPLPDRLSLYSDYQSKLTQLSTGLPQRFRPVLQQLIRRLPNITNTDWPLVPNHTDLLENNIHVEPKTGELAGICDWVDTEISPFGMSLASIENILAVSKKDGLYYQANHQELRDLFYSELYKRMGDVSSWHKERVEDARLIGLFLANGWRYDDGMQLPAVEGEYALCHLDSVLRATCAGYSVDGACLLPPTNE